MNHTSLDFLVTSRSLFASSRSLDFSSNCPLSSTILVRVLSSSAFNVSCVNSTNQAYSEYKHSLTFRVRRYVVIATKPVRAPIANPPIRAQLDGTPYHSPKLHPGPCSSVGMRRGTNRQTDAHTDTKTQRRRWPIYISPRLHLTQNVMNERMTGEFKNSVSFKRKK